MHPYRTPPVFSIATVAAMHLNLVNFNRDPLVFIFSYFFQSCFISMPLEYIRLGFAGNFI